MVLAFLGFLSFTRRLQFEIWDLKVKNSTQIIVFSRFSKQWYFITYLKITQKCVLKISLFLLWFTKRQFSLTCFTPHTEFAGVQQNKYTWATLAHENHLNSITELCQRNTSRYYHVVIFNLGTILKKLKSFQPCRNVVCKLHKLSNTFCHVFILI